MTFSHNARTAGGIARLMSGIGPQIMLDKPNEGELPDDAVAKAAAEALAAREAEAAAAREAEEAAARANADPEKAQLLREVMEKKKKAQDATAEAARLATELKRFEGIDLDEVKKLLADKSKRELADAEAKGEFERVKEMMRTEAAADRKRLEDELAANMKQLQDNESVIDRLTIGSDFSGSEFIREDLVLTPARARTLFGAHFEIKDGKTVAYDKPKGESERTMLVDANGESLPFEVAIKKIIEKQPDRDALLKSKAKPGASSKAEILPIGDKPKPGAPVLYGVARIRAGLEKAI